MSNAPTSKQHTDNRSDPFNDAPSPRPLRRVLSTVRRGWDDATYLNKRFFERS